MNGKAVRYRLAGALLAIGLLAAGASEAQANPQDDGNAGLDAIKSGDYAKAVQLFTRALAAPGLSPDDREFAYVQRGGAYLNLGNKTAATLDFQRALKIKPDDADARQGLAAAHSGGSGSRGRGGGGGANPLELAKQGQAAFDSGDYASAVDLFSRAIGSDRMSSDDLELAYLSRGRAYLKQGDARSAIQDLDDALARKADDGDAQQALGEAFNKLPPPSPAPTIDPGACKQNMTSTGSAMTGKSFTSFADYAGLDRVTAFAGLYRAVNRHSPAFGSPLSITVANARTGVLIAAVTAPGTEYQVKLDARVESNASATRVTMTEEMTGPILMVDIKGSICKSLNDLVR